MASIEPATARECPDCARLLVAQLEEHGVRANAARLARVLEAVVADPARGFVLAARDHEGGIVGVAYAATILSAEHGGPVAWLEELYVTPRCRGRGIGTTLLRAVLERVREEGMLAVDLEIDARHARAASLYERLDFRRLDRTRWALEMR